VSRSNPNESAATGFAILLLSMAFVGCNGGGGDPTASAAATGAPATCDGAAAEYGDGFGAVFVKKGQPESVKAAVKEAVVRSCKEDKWDDATLGCLNMASRMKARTGTDTLDACVSGLPQEMQTKMESRVKAQLK
jgi:NAD(P)H-hydrate repair Nnr-like enzyme with NAD(P)H-hydrate dehydratase domain